MFYLVRDGAADGRPLIGIAALGNTVLGLAQRDDYAGWNSSGLRTRWAALDAQNRRRLANRLLEVVEEGVTGTFSDDIFPDGISDDWRAAVAEAERIGSVAAGERVELLSDYEGERDEDYLAIRAAHTTAQQQDPSGIDWNALASTALLSSKAGEHACRSHSCSRNTDRLRCARSNVRREGVRDRDGGTRPRNRASPYQAERARLQRHGVDYLRSSSAVPGCPRRQTGGALDAEPDRREGLRAQVLKSGQPDRVGSRRASGCSSHAARLAHNFEPVRPWQQPVQTDSNFRWSLAS